MMKKTFYDKLTKKYQKPLLSSLEELVAIPSVYDEKSKDEVNPFGKGVTDALKYVEEMAKKDGFLVKNYDNKIVEIICGSGEKNITIMAHADVVPAASGWNVDPFKVTYVKDVLYGRGVSDDKGPLLASYYAMKALKDKKLLGNNHQIRFLVGGNEESGSLCVYHYFEELKKPAPTYGFSPDADFPLIFAEKGITNFEIKKKISAPGLISISGGAAPNSVIEKCEVKMKIKLDFIQFIADHYSKKEAIIETYDDVTTVTFLGKAAHGATPELGKNAGWMAINALASFYKDKDFTFLSNKLEPLDGSGYDAYGESEEMGHNSSNLGLISYHSGEFKATVNFRFVETVDKEKIKKVIQKSFEPFEVNFVADAPLLYFPKDSVLVSTLLKSYQEETFDYQSQPLAIGGGTYAKETSNVVAFGMQFPGWESNMHSPGESVRKADLFKAMSVYARAIVDLGKKIDEN